MSDKKSLSIQWKEILMEQLRNFICLYSKSKISCNERDKSCRNVGFHTKRYIQM